MTFDWQQHLRETAQWYMALQEQPAWKAHARQRVKELLAQPEWQGLPAVIQELRRERDAAAQGRSSGAGNLQAPV